jgi:hypothetical protein
MGAEPYAYLMGIRRALKASAYRDRSIALR